MTVKVKARLIDANGLKRTISRLAYEIVERNKGIQDVVLVGVRTRGVFLAERINHEIERIEKSALPMGILDITMYRDDFRELHSQPQLQQTEINFDIDKKNVVLVDDVLYTGRTTRAALEALMAFGRPTTIQLAVLIDRGHRQLPIKPDFVGKSLVTSLGEEVQLKMKEIDDDDCVLLVETDRDNYKIED
ncbi:bifunctional pyr operon transcriptional regulator/uracil phosphoribosyltransferase PyrR [candidate division KSB1 bacterium]|nr:bifunctional pyr operon transcriptional regulator/uracil phosphoribosyltransferase PyrR [candidate division KSB1 bacterium]